ncbi:hypothetical protein A9Q86_02250 [Flavobacteriales bacterium 33_180_T64]|nr:hypothetical protein A9Q86_02250 [Flavobacteriales bacterium 33_180_T64]
MKIKSCTYYHRFDEPVNPFEGKRTPSERELDLMHLRRYCALEHMEENERRGFLDWHKEFYKTYKNHF